MLVIYTTCTSFIFNNNNLPFFKPFQLIATRSRGMCHVCDINIHSARALQLGQQSVEKETKNACSKYSRLQHRLQHSFTYAQPHLQANSTRCQGMFKVTVKDCGGKYRSWINQQCDFIHYHVNYYCDKVCAFTPALLWLWCASKWLQCYSNCHKSKLI